MKISCFASLHIRSGTPLGLHGCHHHLLFMSWPSIPTIFRNDKLARMLQMVVGLFCPCNQVFVWKHCFENINEVTERHDTVRSINTLHIHRWKQCFPHLPDGWTKWFEIWWQVWKNRMLKMCSHLAELCVTHPWQITGRKPSADTQRMVGPRAKESRLA